MSTPQQPTPNPEESAEYRPRHAEPEAPAKTGAVEPGRHVGQAPGVVLPRDRRRARHGRETDRRQPGGRPDVVTALLAGVALRVFFFDADLIPAQN